MKLSYSPTSPYARKVRAVAYLKGISDRIELVAIDTWNIPESLRAANPLGKVPCLARDDGSSLYDSPVICEYLDCLTLAPRLFPAEGEPRWSALRLQALADGIMDAAVERYVEMHRPSGKQMREWSERQAKGIARALDRMESVPEEFAGETIGTVSLACALGYLDLRFPGDHWREGRPALAFWFEMCSNQAWMIETAPPA